MRKGGSRRPATTTPTAASPCITSITGCAKGCAAFRNGFNSNSELCSTLDYNYRPARVCCTQVLLLLQHFSSTDCLGAALGESDSRIMCGSFAIHLFHLVSVNHAAVLHW